MSSNDNKVNYIVFGYTTYKKIINTIQDIDTLYTIHSQNKMLVLTEEKNVAGRTYYVLDMKLVNEPRQNYAMGMKSPTSHIVTLINNSTIKKPDSDLTLESLQEKIIQQYEILLQQQQTHIMK